MSLSVNGSLEMKLGMTDFISCVEKIDVVFLSETWANEMNKLDIDDFS